MNILEIIDVCKSSFHDNMSPASAAAVFSAMLLLCRHNYERSAAGETPEAWRALCEAAWGVTSSGIVFG